MKEITAGNFGLIIAYLLPGFVVLWGISPVSATIDGWLGAAPDAAPTIGGFLYATLASVAAGLTVSTVRWLVIDTLHHHTGIQQPAWDFGRLARRFDAFEGLVEQHYRYYQFYGNTLIAVIVVWLVRIAPAMAAIDRRIHAAFMIFALILFIGSRDALRKYWNRTAQLLAASAKR
jgi:hypothetical protein